MSEISLRIELPPDGEVLVPRAMELLVQMVNEQIELVNPGDYVPLLKLFLDSAESVRSDPDRVRARLRIGGEIYLKDGTVI